MRNVFMLYMPPGNYEAMVHYRETIQERVPLERIARFVSRDVIDRLRAIFGSRPIAVWGSRDSTANRSKYERMTDGDDLLIVEGGSIKLMGKVALKLISPDLSRELWKNLRGDTSEGWDLIYFIANPRPLDVPFTFFCELMGYQPGYQLRGFTTVSTDKLEAFYRRYDDLYSVLERIVRGEPVAVRGEFKETPLEPYQTEAMPVELEPEDVEQVLQSPLVSDHIKMQWKLLNLGLKSGAKVWIPLADQTKLRRIYEYNEFESEFASGIDLPHSYVENIDVVWKEEFRIDAAFEVENSTAIYSGLLRFADLTILAPNTTYPMFIVAPVERRNRVREQLLRPTFKRLNLRDKVRFLSYEAVDEIDRFFAPSASGLNVDVVKAKAEALVT